MDRLVGVAITGTLAFLVAMVGLSRISKTKHGDEGNDRPLPLNKFSTQHHWTSNDKRQEAIAKAQVPSFPWEPMASFPPTLLSRKTHVDARTLARAPQHLKELEFLAGLTFANGVFALLFASAVNKMNFLPLSPDIVWLKLPLKDWASYHNYFEHIRECTVRLTPSSQQSHSSATVLQYGYVTPNREDYSTVDYLLGQSPPEYPSRLFESHYRWFLPRAIRSTRSLLILAFTAPYCLICIGHNMANENWVFWPNTSTSMR